MTRTRILFSSIAIAVAIVSVGAVPATAVTNGQLDGGAHPNVGALSADFGSGKEWICSGVLVAPRVFVTAAHCTTYLSSAGIAPHDVYVTFASTFDASGTFVRGTMVTNPGYNQRQSDPEDIAVVLLDAVPGGNVTPAQLPSTGLLDTMRASGVLRDALVTAVGYGSSQRVTGSGPPSFFYDGKRRNGVEAFSALNAAWLRLSENPARDLGGGCYGDSGGPNFLGTNGVVLSLTITGDAVCRATNTTYRLDTPSARAFLGQFVTLP
jgi:secreted trypsin-like serine protease